MIKDFLNVLIESDLKENTLKTITNNLLSYDDDQLLYLIKDGVNISKDLILYYIDGMGFRCENINSQIYGKKPVCGLIERKLNTLLKTHYGSAGIVFVYDNKYLLVHPTNFDVWSYPKGHIEGHENLRQASIREVEEELKIKLPSDFLDNITVQELSPVLKEKGIKHYWFFKYYLSSEEFQIYFNNSFEIPKENLQI